MFGRLSLVSLPTFVTQISTDLWSATKNYVFVAPLVANQNLKKIAQVERDRSSEKPRAERRVDFKRLLILSTIGLLSATRNQAGLSLGLATLFVDSVDAAYPTVTNPIPTQYAQLGQAWSYDIDLNQVFNDTDGDIMTFGGVTMADGSSLPSWLSASPILLGTYATPSNAYGVAVQNEVAYVTDYNYGLQLINVSNASAPQLLSTCGTLGYACSIAVQNGVAYVADYDYGLQLINVSDVSSPRLVGTVDTPGAARGIAVQNGLAYVADGTSGLQLVNVSNVSAPRLLGAYNTPGYAYSVAVQNGVAYVTDDTSGLQLINVSNALAPRLLGTYNTPDQASSVIVQNNVAYVADGYSGLQLISVSNPLAPSLLGNYNTLGYAISVAMQNRVIYIADASGLQLINISNPGSPTFLGKYITPGTAHDIVVQNGVAYVADYTSGLQIIGLKVTRLNAEVPFNATGNYSLKVHATNENGEWVSTSLELRIGMAPNLTLVPTAAPMSSTNTSVPNSQSAASSPSSTSFSLASNSFIFNIIVSSNSVVLESDTATLLTTEILTLSGNVNPDQVIYTVQGNHPDIVITVNGVETTQFTQADVEGNFVEIALQGITCQDYSTDLQLEANVAGSNAPAQQVSIALVLQETTCTDAGRLSAFSFRDANIGFWAQKREAEKEVQPAYLLRLQH